jgi:hypothetical protein
VDSRGSFPEMERDFRFTQIVLTALRAFQRTGDIFTPKAKGKEDANDHLNLKCRPYDEYIYKD